MIGSAYPDVRAMIGDTPIVALTRIGRGLPNVIYGKCEFMNPGGSVKDRIGFAMVEQAEKEGLLKSGGTIVEATAGNTGMGLAMAAAHYGYRLFAVMTTKMSKEKVNLLRAFGAKIEICPYEVPPDSPQHFITRARIIAAQTPGAWYADQFNNETNRATHYRTTGPELWRQTDGRVDALVGGIGTGGTLCGAGSYFKQQNANIRIVLADPVGSILKDTLEGTAPRPKGYLVEGIGGDFIPGLARLDIIDEAIAIDDSEAITTAKRLFREEGLFVGASSGCILAAALKFAARRYNRSLNIIALLPDGGRSYLSTIYNPEWLASASSSALELTAV